MTHTSTWRTARRSGLVVAMLAVALAWPGCSAATGGAGASDAASVDGGALDGAAPHEIDASTADAAHDSAKAGGDGGDGGAPSSPECVTYCDTIQGACNGDYPQFGTAKACLAACALYPPGAPDDTSGSGNTLKCRQQHATSAVSGTYHCFHAGPYGYGGCGAMCEGFCQIAMGWCAASAGGAPFASAAACAAECEKFTWAPSGADGLAAYRAYGPTTGDTLECREFQLVKALESTADRDVYCPRAATNSASCR